MKLGEFLSKKESVVTPVRIDPLVRTLLASNEIPDGLSAQQQAIAQKINILKGTQFYGSPGYVLSVMETGSNMARALNTDFNLELLRLVMDVIVRRDGIPVNLDDPKAVDLAWDRYLTPKTHLR